MQESLLQFIWQYYLYQPGNLYTTTGAPVTVLSCGTRNTDAGPDFISARIRIGGTLFAGNVELHVHSKDWYRHGHQHDPSYRTVILHVVYLNDMPPPADMPVLELGPHIPAAVLHRYTTLLQTPRPIPCSGRHGEVHSLTRHSWMGRMLAERWEHKLSEWEQQLKLASGCWLTLLYWRLAANFGFRTNAVPFLMLAQSLPLKLLLRQHNSLFRTEALLFGQAGMLAPAFCETYPARLQEEYGYLRHKYRLTPLPAHIWKFMRMRPANFPSVRIAQFAAFIHKNANKFSFLLEEAQTSCIRSMLAVKAGSYWDNHFRPDKPARRHSPKLLGTDSADNILINTIAPMRFLYALHQGLPGLREQAFHMLEEIAPEQNQLIRQWQQAGWNPENAAQSQALIQLFRSYCSAKKCLECSIGLGIIKNATPAGTGK